MKFPKTLYVYQFDEEEGLPVYAFESELENIPFDMNGGDVATYELKQAAKLDIRYELIPGPANCPKKKGKA